MKIIKRGTPPGDRPWEGKCRACNSMASAVESELTRISHARQGESDYSWEECPVCKVGSTRQGYGGMLFHPVGSKS